jgi:hypothetical protein
MFIKIPKCTYVYDDKKDKNSDLLHDRPVFSTGGRPTTNKTATVFDYNQDLVVSPGGSQRQDGRTDRPSVAK